jgi:hypothetical protein
MIVVEVSKMDESKVPDDIPKLEGGRGYMESSPLLAACRFKLSFPVVRKRKFSAPVYSPPR